MFVTHTPHTTTIAVWMLAGWWHSLVGTRAIGKADCSHACLYLW